MGDFELLAEEYFSGNRCSGCHQLTLARGCRCSLDRLYAEDELAVTEWLESLPQEVRMPPRGTSRKDPLARIKIDPSARSALTRRRRQCGLQDLPADGEGPTGMSAATDTRLGFEQQLKVVPRYFKPYPGSKWTPRADLEPL